MGILDDEILLLEEDSAKLINESPVEDILIFSSIYRYENDDNETDLVEMSYDEINEFYYEKYYNTETADNTENELTTLSLRSINENPTSIKSTPITSTTSSVYVNRTGECIKKTIYAVANKATMKIHITYSNSWLEMPEDRLMDLLELNWERTSYLEYNTDDPVRVIHKVYDNITKIQKEMFKIGENRRGIIMKKLKIRIVSFMIVIIMVAGLTPCANMKAYGAEKNYNVAIMSDVVKINSKNKNVNGMILSSISAKYFLSNIIGMLDEETMVYDNFSFNDSSFSSENNIYSKRSMTVSSKVVSLSDIIIVENCISLYSDSVKSEQAIIISKKGDITINASKVTRQLCWVQVFWRKIRVKIVIMMVLQISMSIVREVIHDLRIQILMV